MVKEFQNPKGATQDYLHTVMQGLQVSGTGSQVSQIKSIIDDLNKDLCTPEEAEKRAKEISKGENPY